MMSNSSAMMMGMHNSSMMSPMGMMPSAAVDMMHPEDMVGASALSASIQREEKMRLLSRADPMYSSSAAAMGGSSLHKSSPSSRLAARAAAAGLPGSSDPLMMQEMLERERLLARSGM